MGSIKSNSFDEFNKNIIEELNNDLKVECENLLSSSGYDSEQKERFEQELWNYSEEELNKLKANLYMNQVDRIDNGLNYNQTDIKRKLRNYDLQHGKQHRETTS